MSQSTQVGATFPPDGLEATAFNNGLFGLSPGAVMRYLAYLAAGHNHDEALSRVLPSRTPLSAFEGRNTMEKTTLPQSVIDQIRARYPDKSVSWALRYHMALSNGASEDQAQNLADGFKVGRPKGAKDSKPRKRRTKAELEQARNAA